MGMKRLAIFAPDMTVGGAERSILKLAGGLGDHGYPVDLVLSVAQGPLMAEVPDSVRVVDLKARRVLTSLPALVRYLKREKPDAMLSILHGNLVTLWARRLAGVATRIVVSERNTLSVETHENRGDLRMRFMPSLVRRYYPWADGIVAVSKGVAADLTRVAGLPEDCVRVIYNPIVTPAMQAKACEPMQDSWFEPAEPPVILAVGRLSAQKDFTTLIRAFAKVRQSTLAHLLILGDGEERSRLEALVRKLGLKNDVRLPGFVPNPYPYMCRADVFVLSSRWEGLPGVLIEALYCGTPLVSTDCPSGPREILADGQYGKLVPVGDQDAMCRAILDVLGGNGKPTPPESWQPFTLDEAVNQYLAVMLDGHP
jgi:glycosyltransferase involved in cell wall biosynthesis